MLDLYCPPDPYMNALPAPLSRRADTTLAELVAALGHTPEGVATAVNGVFVPRPARDQALHAGDAVLLFQAITGG